MEPNPGKIDPLPHSPTGEGEACLLPRGLAGEEITLAARILNVADTIDAMISERPYRGRISIQDVLLELERESGRQFDPLVAESAQRLIQKGLLNPGKHFFHSNAAGADNTTHPDGEALHRRDGAF